MNKYIRAISANLVFFILNVLFFILITPLAIHTMGDAVYGVWSMMNAIILFSNIGNLGIGPVLSKFLAESPRPGDTDRQHVDRLLTGGTLILLAMAALVAAVLFFSRDFLASNMGLSAAEGAQFHLALGILAISIFPRFLVLVPGAYLAAQLRTFFSGAVDFLGNVILWVGAIVGVYFFSADIRWLAWWFLANSVIVFSAYYVWLVGFAGFRPDFRSGAFHKLISVSGFAFLQSLSVALFQQFDRILVGLAIDVTLAGVYSVGTSVALRLSIVTGQFTQVMIPFASLKDSLQDYERLLTVFRQLSRTISLIVALLASGLILWMTEILSIWISPQYARQYSNTFALMVIGYGWLSLSRAGHQTLTGMGRFKFASIIYFLASIISLSGIYFFSRWWGLPGAAIGNDFMIVLLIYNLYVYYLLGGQMASAIADLWHGMFLPPLFYVCAVFFPSVGIKIALTFFLCVIIWWLVSRETWMKPMMPRPIQPLFWN